VIRRAAQLAFVALSFVGFLTAVLLAFVIVIYVFIATLHRTGLIASASAAEVAPPPERIVVPATSYLYRFKLQREVVARFGEPSSLARIAAQVHQESLWRADARSPYAEGLAQFTPATGAWLSKDVCPEIGPPDPWSADWSVRAVVCYDAWLYARVADAATPCDRWAFAFGSYNGGLANLQRDQRRASAKGADPARWFDHVERFSARARWAFVENRNYVRRILTLLEPAYLAAGWSGTAVCA